LEFINWGGESSRSTSIVSHVTPPPGTKKSNANSTPDAPVKGLAWSLLETLAADPLLLKINETLTISKCRNTQLVLKNKRQAVRYQD
jgi:hypothetical protein